MSDANFTNEIWKQIPGWEGLYAASNLGRIMNLTGSRVRSGPYLCSLTRFNKTGSKTPYIRVSLWRPVDKRATNYEAHRLIAKAFIGDTTGRQVNHLNGNGTDNRVENLEICTASKNRFHATRILGHGVGSLHGMAKTDEAMVRTIKAMLKDGRKPKAVAEATGVSYDMVLNIKNNKNWVHVKI